MAHNIVTHDINRLSASIAAAIAVSFICGAAAADPGPSILQTGGADERTTTSAAACGHENKVYLCKGAARLEGADSEDASASQAGENKTSIVALSSTQGAALSSQRQVRIVIKRPIYRSFRRLRTQGFYSGRGAKSRPITQGFYADRTARRR